LKRGEELEPDGFISDAEMDKLRGDQERALASREAAEAAIEGAQINLEFTEIRAPFSGTAGRSQFSIGDLVGSSTSALVTLVQSDPMLVDFDVTERTLALRIKENQERQAQGLPPDAYTPRLRLVTGDDYVYDGVIDYTSNRVNPSTGTISVTTSFPNPDNTLIPGQFARIVMRRSQPEMRLLVPQPSVLEDMQGRYVYIVDDDDTVARRNVELGQREGIDWVVLTGLNEGDRVIVNGIQKVRPGMPVIASPVGAQPHNESTDAE
jgi:membrane fusion protein (multidrug efflux system)